MMIKEKFQKLYDVVKLLRDPIKGCPWDIKQTHKSIRPYLVEETYEALEAIDEENDEELKAELGDVLLQVMLHAQIASDRQVFGIEDIIEGITNKMIQRHPHVFGDVEAKTAEQVLINWEKIKLSNNQKEDGSIKQKQFLDGVPKDLPALTRAQRIGEKVSRVGFDWKNKSEVLEKVREELGEFLKEVETAQDNKKVEEEFGDMLFALAQLARHLDFNAEDSLRAANNKFVRRFSYIEQNLAKGLGESDIEEMEQLWSRAKESGL